MSTFEVSRASILSLAFVWQDIQAIPVATMIEVEPASSDDWEILEQNSGHLEEEMLNQACAVFLFCYRSLLY